MGSADEVFPSFFIVGAPKCGTTALYSYLREHPDIFLPELKEPHYFSTDLPGLRVTTGMNAYCALFHDAPSGKMIGEASASYLHSRDAIAAIRLSTFIARHNVETRPRRPLDPELRRELATEFAPQVATLSRLLGRDLSHWSAKNSAGIETG